MSAKHTPGPWFLRFEDIPLRHSGVPFEIEKDGFLISGACAAREQTDGTFSNDEARANARLIAAAPDLLKALKVMAKHHATSPHIGIARAAIAEAEGSQP